MQNAIISIVYHSIHGHTEQAAMQLAEFLHSDYATILLINIDNIDDRWDDLHAADTIVFGCPTYFGNISARFKAFMEATGTFWYKQLWRDKFAGAFTVSPTAGGDKLLTLQALAIFAAQHSMHWISPGILPRFLNDQQTRGQNRLASYLGLMIQSDNSEQKVAPFHSGDLLTLELFAHRILNVTLIFKNTKIKNHETLRN